MSRCLCVLLALLLPTQRPLFAAPHPSLQRLPILPDYITENTPLRADTWASPAFVGVPAGASVPALKRRMHLAGKVRCPMPAARFFISDMQALDGSMHVGHPLAVRATGLGRARLQCIGDKPLLRRMRGRVMPADPQFQVKMR